MSARTWAIAGGLAIAAVVFALGVYWRSATKLYSAGERKVCDFQVGSVCLWAHSEAR